MSKQCQGTTKQANQCKFDAQPNSLYCRIHSGSGTPKSKLKVGASIKLNKETHPPQESQQSVEIWIPETLIKLYEDDGQFHSGTAIMVQVDEDRGPVTQRGIPVRRGFITWSISP